MTVEEKMRAARSAAIEGAGQDDRVTGRGMQGRLDANLAAVLDQPVGACPHISAMLGLSGNAGKPDIIAEFPDESLFVFLKVSKDFVHKIDSLLLIVLGG